MNKKNKKITTLIFIFLIATFLFFFFRNREALLEVANEPVVIEEESLVQENFEIREDLGEGGEETQLDSENILVQEEGLTQNQEEVSSQDQEEIKIEDEVEILEEVKAEVKTEIKKQMIVVEKEN